MIDPVLGGLLSILLLLVLIFARVHVGLALGLSGFLGLLLVTGNTNNAMAVLTTTPYYITAVFAFAVVPLFLLMGSFAGYVGISEDIYNTGEKWLGKLPGGLAMATVGANALFGFVCGSSVAAAAIFTKIALPEMNKHGYSRSFSCGSIASAGVLAMLIPPSTLMILYGILTEQSIGLIFIAGILPGFLLSALYCIGILATVRANPGIAPRSEAPITWKERFVSLKNVWGIAVLGIIVLGGIYAGIFTPTEAGAAGAFGSFLLALLMRKLTFKRLRDSLLDASTTTGIIFLIIVGAQIYTKFLVFTGITGKLMAWIAATG
ncbi:MAG TPA: TRAP transporter large permease subunit, partial [Thermoleophilia bacterium]|nr:TRAP transporter large permease subunit [Thermoleophilia bacterium]